MGGNSTSTPSDMSRAGLGYGIGIALGIVVLVTALKLAYYAYLRVHQQTQIGSAADAHGSNATVIHVTVQDHQNSSAAAAAAAMAVPGLDQATLDSYPKFVYSEEKKKKGDQSSCSICLGDYKDSDLLRRLPDCGHDFHVMCIDAWMKMHATCPMCRASPLPSPLSTPMSELVPLARHATGIQR